MTCPVCYRDDNAYLRCNRPDCTDGRHRPLPHTSYLEAVSEKNPLQIVSVKPSYDAPKWLALFFVGTAVFQYGYFGDVAEGAYWMGAAALVRVWETRK